MLIHCVQRYKFLFTHSGETQSNGYYEELQYSVPSDLVPVTQYETPVITSPTGAQKPSQPPPVYNYAHGSVPQSTAPEYAVLGPQTHVYQYLESPEAHTDTPATQECEKIETAKDEQKVAQEPSQPPSVYDYAHNAVPQSTAPEYAVLEPQAHVYQYLESPEAHTATPTAVEYEKTEIAKEEQKVAGDGTLNQDHEYSAIE